MTTYPLFRIDENDFTSFIKMPTYQINQIPVYNEWTDANGTIHRDIYRQSVEGEFTIWFEDTDDYFNFFNIVNNYMTTEGWVPVSFYLNNKDSVYDGRFFLDMQPANELPYMGSKTHDGFSVTVKEK